MEIRLSISIISELKDFYELEKEWKELLQNSSSVNVFLTWEWMSSWWECFSSKRNLWIMTVRRDSDGSLLGIAPFNIQIQVYRKFFRYRELSFFENQIAAPDHLDIISASGFEEEVANAIFEYLLKKRLLWDVIRLDNFNSESLLLKCLLKYGKSSASVSHEPCPFILLPDSWESYISGLSKNERHNVFRYGNRLKKEFSGQIEYLRVEKKENLSEMVDVLTTLHLARKAEQQKASTFKNDHLLTFIRKIAYKFHENDWLHFYLLRVRHEPIAGILCFCYKNIFSFYQQGHNPSWAVFSPGRQITAFAIQQAIRHGACEFDFLRGDESFKYNWTDKIHRDIYFTMATNNRGRLLFKIRNINSKIKTKYFKKMQCIYKRIK